MSKVIIISAPSGSGKSTLIKALMAHPLNLHFSISATSRPPRGSEQNGVEYFFLSTDEYEEVYPGRFYGTLRSQVENQLAHGQNVILDIDVQGGCHVKEVFGPRALSLFIQPPSIDELRRRLEGRGTDSPEVIQSRIDKAAFELTFAPRFDRTIINDDLEVASSELLQVVEQFLSSER